jgi:hypothetical protein
MYVRVKESEVSGAIQPPPEGVPPSGAAIDVLQRQGTDAGVPEIGIGISLLGKGEAAEQ